MPVGLYKSFVETVSAVYECIYTRGQWKRACGEIVDMTINALKNQFIHLMRTYPKFFLQNNGGAALFSFCNRCKPGSNIKTYTQVESMISNAIFSLLFDSQSQDIFKTCSPVDYPLNKCHTQHIWRRDVFSMFCHKVNFMIAPQLEPHLPLCDFAEWIQSAKRICNMEYDKFMDMAGHMYHCTDGKDELFPCYKGLFLDRSFSWGLVTASRLWSNYYKNENKIGAVYRAVYLRIKQCSYLVYDHLSRTCRFGSTVVTFIQDLRTVLYINQHYIASFGGEWRLERNLLEDEFHQYVEDC